MKAHYILAAICVALVAVLAAQPASGAYSYEGTVVAVGDSNTRPNNMSPDQMWPGILSTKLGTQIINKGVPAEPTSDMLAHFQEDVLDNDAAMVIIMGGTNDIGRGINARDVSVTAIEHNLRTMYDTALKNNIVVIACTILPNDTFMNWQKTMVDQVNAWIRAQASDRIIVADTNAAARSSGDPDHYNPAYVRDDGVHLNATGHQVIANTIYAVAPAHLAANDIQKPTDWGVDTNDGVPSLYLGGVPLIVVGVMGAILIAVLVVDVMRSGKPKK